MAFPTSETMIPKAEEALGLRLPESLRRYLLSENGGEIDADSDSWVVFPVADSSDRKRLSRSANHIVRETAHARGWSGFPPDAVAVASNGSGDFLVLKPDPSDSGQADSAVFRWDHETRQLIWIAADWAELLSSA
jgi:hypothetical protein